MIIRPRYHIIKPTGGVVINGAHPLVQGLLSAYLLNEGGGNRVNDLIGVDHLTNWGATGSGTPAWNNARRTLDQTTGLYGTASARLKINPPVSIAWRGFITGNAAAYGSVFGVSENDTSANPYTSYLIAFDNASPPKLVAYYNRSGTFTGIISSVSGASLNTGKPVLLVFTGIDGAQRLYADGVEIASSIGTAWTVTQYQSSARISFSASNTADPGNSVLQGDYGMIWNRVLTRSEILELTQNPYGWLRPPSSPINRFYFSPPPTTITGSAGIASSEAFGADGALTAIGITGSAGIPSSEAFGADGVLVSMALLGSTGIPSSEAFGTGGTLSSLTIIGSTGIPSSEAFGADGELLGVIAGSAGIASSEAFGADGELTPVVAGLTGIPSSEAFGTTGFLHAITDEDENESPYRFYIDGLDRTAHYHPGTLKIENPKASIATATFTLEGTNVALIEERRTRFDIGAIPDTSFDVSPYVTWQSVEVYKTSAATGEREHMRRGASYDYTIVTSNTIQFTVGSAPVEGDVVEIVYFDPTDIIYKPTTGSQILIYSYPFVWNSTLRIMEADRTQPMERIYAGTINDIDTEVAPTTKHHTFQVGCTDYTQRISKRQFTYNFPGGTVTSLLQVMQTQIFDDEGIAWVDWTDPGVTLPKKDYDASCDDVLNEIGNAIGWDWKIDFFLNFRMGVTPMSPTAFPHGTLEDDDDKTRVVRTRETRAKYRNVQGIRRTGQDRTNRATATFTVDAGGDLTGTYRVPLFMEAKPIVTVNGTEQVVDAYPVTLGGVDCYYKPSEFKVQFLSGHFPPALATVVISYVSNLGNTDIYADSGAIAARAALEGGSGRYDRVSSFGGFSGVNTADLAAGLTDRFGEIDLSGVIETDRFGILPGQVVTLAFDNPDFVGTFYVESISSVDDGGMLLRHTLAISRTGKKGNGVTDTLGGGIGNGGGWSGGGGGEWPGPWDGGSNVNAFTETGGVNVYTTGAPQQYTFPVAPTVPGCANEGMASTGATSIPRIIPFPGVIREVQAYVAVHDGDQDIIFDVELNGASIFDPAKRPTFTPHGSATPDFTIEIFDDITPIAVQRGDLLQVILVQAGASGAIVDPTGEELGQDGLINVVVY